MVIKFSDDATTATMGSMLDALIGWTLEIEYVKRFINVNGEPTEVDIYPTQCSIVEADVIHVVICDVDEEGRPLTSIQYQVRYDEIESITVV